MSDVKSPRKIYLKYFGLFALIGLPLVIWTQQPFFFGLTAGVIALIWSAIYQFRKRDNG